MKVIFLDVDGVLNHDKTKDRIPGVPYLGLEQALVDAFLSFLKDKDVKIVLSSTWRKLDVAKEYLNQKGIFWIDTTPVRRGQRGGEIKEWLDNNPNVTHFAILDDNSDMYPVGAKLVQTSCRHGVTSKHLDKIAKLLEI